MVGMTEGKGTLTPEQEKEAPTQSQVSQSKPWTLKEYAGKTVWDWLQLLIVPVMLLLITVAFSLLGSKTSARKLLKSSVRRISRCKGTLIRWVRLCLRI